MKKRVLGIFLVLFLAVTLIACGGGNSEDKKQVTEALDLASAFSGNPATEGITRDQSFSTSLRDYPDVEITWSSSHPAVLSNEGKVTRPEAGSDDVMVTITVTAKKGKAEESKEVKFLVLAFIAAEKLTLSDLYDSKTELSTDKYSYDYLGEFVEIEELTVVGIYNNQNGFYLTDGVRLLFIYNPDLAKTVALDEVYNVKGTFGHNYGSAQISDDAELVKVTGATPKKAPLVVATVDENLVDARTYSADFLFEPVGYKLTGRVLVDDGDDSASYQTYLVNPTYTDYKIVKQVSGGKAVSFHAPTVLIYYQGIMDPIKELDGRIITIPYFPAGARSDRGGLNYGVFLDIDALEIHEESDADKAVNIENKVKKTFIGKRFPDSVTELDLFATIEGYEDLTITWKSLTPEFISDEGIITSPNAESATAKLEATITFGTNDPVVLELEFEVLGEITVMSVADAIASDVSAVVHVEGIVNQYEPKNFHVFDGTTGITMRDNNDLLKDLDKNKSYIISGTIGEFDSVKQIAVTAVKESETPVVITNVEVTGETDLTTVQAQILNVQGTVTASPNEDKYGNTWINITVGTVSLSLKFDDRIAAELDSAQTAILKGIVASEEAPVTLKITGTTIVGTRLYMTTATQFEVIE